MTAVTISLFTVSFIFIIILGLSYRKRSVTIALFIKTKPNKLSYMYLLISVHRHCDRPDSQEEMHHFTVTLELTTYLHRLVISKRILACVELDSIP